MILVDSKPPPTSNIAGITDRVNGDTKPPVVGNGLAEAVAVALAEALALADMLDIAEALGDILDMADALVLDMAEAEADMLDMAEALAEDIISSSIISSSIISSSIISSSIMLWLLARAAGARTNTAAMQRAANNSNLLTVLPSVGFPLLKSTCTLHSLAEGYVRQLTKPASTERRNRARETNRLLHVLPRVRRRDVRVARSEGFSGCVRACSSVACVVGHILARVGFSMVLSM